MSQRFLVVDLGGSQARAAVADESLDLSGRQEEPTDHSRGPESVVDQLARLCRRAAESSRVELDGIVRLVVACPGPLDAGTGVVYDPPNLLGWREVPLRQMLEAELGIPVTIVNDANAAALGEFHFGAGRGTRNLVYLTISTGIGGGVVVDGRLLAGTSGSGGELGHMTIDRHGPICPCGNIGCLEAIGSGRAIAHRYAEEVARAGGTLPAPAPGAREVAQLAENGDPVALAVLHDAIAAVGTGVVSCVNVFNPDVIVLGGGLTNLGERLFAPVREAVSRYALPRPRSSVRVLPAELGSYVGLVGAAGVAVEGGAEG